MQCVVFYERLGAESYLDVTVMTETTSMMEGTTTAFAFAGATNQQIAFLCAFVKTAIDVLFSFFRPAPVCGGGGEVDSET